MTSTASKPEKVADILPRTEAGQVIRDHEEAYTRLVTATEALGRLKNQRAKQKIEAIARLRSQGYTETSAKDFAQYDAQYAAYKADVLAAEVEREEAFYATENARLRAEILSRPAQPDRGQP